MLCDEVGVGPLLTHPKGGEGNERPVVSEKRAEVADGGSLSRHSVIIGLIDELNTVMRFLSASNGGANARSLVGFYPYSTVPVSF